MATTSFQVICGDCGRELVKSAKEYPNDLGACPDCGSLRKQIGVGIEDKLTMLEEFDGTALDRHGVIKAERISRTDGNTSSTLAADLAQPAQIVSVRERRVEGFDEEGGIAEALAK